MYSVLIVEDELLVSIGLRNMIDWAALGMQVVGDAPNGEEALALYRRLRPDLILTDIKMPVMDGIQLIEAIRAEDARTRIVILTCVQEFESLHRAMRLSVSDYILKLTMTTRQMTEVIARVKGELDSAGGGGGAFSDTAYLAEKLLQDYICNGRLTEEAFRAALPRSALGLPEQGLCVCLLQVRRADGQEGAERLSAILRNLLGEQLEREGRGHLVWAREDKFLMVLSLGSQPSRLKRQSTLAAVLGRLRENVKTYLDAGAYFSLSTLADGYGRLPALYEEARAAHAESYYTGRLPYTQYAAPENRQSFGLLVEAFGRAIDENALLESAYKDVIRQGVDALGELYGAPRQQVWELFERLIHWPAAHAAHQADRLFTLALETAYGVRSCADLAGVVEVFGRFLQALQGRRQLGRPISREVARVVQYIHAHYSEEISLQLVAGHVEMSANYLSSLFKKELEIGFVDYLNRVRIEEAGRLLQATNLKTYEVAARVGFSDESYFSRIFKRVKGVRPREYKRAQLPGGPGGELP